MVVNLCCGLVFDEITRTKPIFSLPAIKLLSSEVRNEKEFATHSYPFIETCVPPIKIDFAFL
ncbi:MAG: hypothetical protein WBZ36_25350 [Candidatus Nitrosopolaris sp.]